MKSCGLQLATTNSSVFCDEVCISRLSIFPYETIHQLSVAEIKEPPHPPVSSSINPSPHIFNSLEPERKEASESISITGNEDNIIKTNIS